MFSFDSFSLSNGLRVHVMPQADSAMAHVNLMYDVGSRDEDPHHTGFAHLFEHLMFGGSEHIPAYDTPLQRVGGHNNAYTSSDVTNYHCSLPAVNIETAFWLESDRMQGLSFTERPLEVQRKVVIEEFKENYLNTPYGDAWLHLSALAYTTHPYRWPTIGKEIAHIEQATLEDVKSFFYRFYRPNNAVLVVKGGVTLPQITDLAKKWFGDIPAGKLPKRNLPQEPQQQQAREQVVHADVPLAALYQAYPMAAYGTPHYYATALLAAALGGGRASRGYQQLVKQKRYCHSISVQVTSTFDPGLFIIDAKLNAGITPKQVREYLAEIIAEIQMHGLSDQELARVKQQAIAHWVFADLDPLHAAEELAAHTLWGKPQHIQHVIEHWQAVTPAQVQKAAQTVLHPGCENTLLYLPKRKA